MVERANILPPQGQIGPITVGERDQMIRSSLIYGVYEKLIDGSQLLKYCLKKRSCSKKNVVSLLKRKSVSASRKKPRRQHSKQRGRSEPQHTATESRPGFPGDILTQVGKSTQRQISNELGRTITRSIFGALFERNKFPIPHLCIKYYSNITC